MAPRWRPRTPGRRRTDRPRRYAVDPVLGHQRRASASCTTRVVQRTRCHARPTLRYRTTNAEVEDWCRAGEPRPPPPPLFPPPPPPPRPDPDGNGSGPPRALHRQQDDARRAGPATPGRAAGQGALRRRRERLRGRGRLVAGGQDAAAAGAGPAVPARRVRPLAGLHPGADHQPDVPGRADRAAADLGLGPQHGRRARDLPADLRRGVRVRGPARHERGGPRAARSATAGAASITPARTTRARPRTAAGPTATRVRTTSRAARTGWSWSGGCRGTSRSSSRSRSATPTRSGSRRHRSSPGSRHGEQWVGRPYGRDPSSPGGQTHGCRHHPADAEQRTGPHLRARQRRAGLAGGQGQGAGRRAGRADHDDRRRSSGWPAATGSTSSSRTGTGTCSAARPTRPTRTWPPRWTRRWPPGRPGATCRSTSGPRSSCGRPTCWPGRGGTRSTPPPCWASRRPCYQAEIDAACELIDFLRFNVHFGQQILAEQPSSSPGVWNRFDHRPLEGFVFAITPFNFTAIAGNLPTAPALMGNTVVWKPSPTQQFAAHYTMRLLEAAGLPPGVINLVTGDGGAVSEVALADRPTSPASTSPARPRRSSSCGARSAATWPATAGYPRIVGETGGKDFVIAHPSADAGRAAHRAGPGRVRVPGPEVLGRVAGVRAAVAVGGRAARPAGRRPTESLDVRRRHRLRQLRRRGDRPARVRQARRARSDRLSRTPRSARCSPAAPPTTARASSSGRRSSSAPTRPTRCSPPSTSARSSACYVYDDADCRRRRGPGRARRAVRADRVDLRHRPAGDRPGRPGAALRRRQLLHQRQADRRGGRAAAVRRGPGQRHQRQGRLVAQPAALDLAAHDQGDVRPADRPPLPAPGIGASARLAASSGDERAPTGALRLSVCPGSRHSPRRGGRGPAVRRAGRAADLRQLPAAAAAARPRSTSSPTRRRTTSCCSSPSTRSTSCGSSSCCTRRRRPATRCWPATARLWWAQHLLQRMHVIERVLVAAGRRAGDDDPAGLPGVPAAARARPAASSRCSSASWSSSPAPRTRRTCERFRGLTDDERARLQPAAGRADAVGRVPARCSAGRAAGRRRRGGHRVAAHASPHDRASYAEVWALAEALLQHDRGGRAGGPGTW